MTNVFNRYFWSIKKRSIAQIIVLTLVSAVLLTGAYSYLNYVVEMKRIESVVDDLEISMIPVLARNLWEINIDAQEKQIEAIAKLRFVSYLKLEDKSGFEDRVIVKGNYRADLTKKVYHITWEGRGIGDLSIQVDYREITSDAIKKFITLFLFALTVSSFKSFLIYTFIIKNLTKRINSIYRNIIRSRKRNNKLDFLKFDDSFLFNKENPDELDVVILELNQASESMSHSYKQVRELNTNLEKLVEARTSELSKTIKELKDTQSRIVSKEKLAAVGQLSAGLAHEIKNPSYVISGSVSVLKEILYELYQAIEEHKDAIDYTRIPVDVEKDNIIDLLSAIEEGCGSIDRLVSTMLSMTRGELQSMSLVNPNVLIEKATNFTMNAFKHKTGVYVELVKDFDPNVDEINLYADDFTRLIVNIVDNAMYAMREKYKLNNDKNYSPILKITTRSLDSRFEIVLQDNGIGMSEEVLSNILKPFYTTKQSNGTGLGLALVTDIINRHSGSLNVESIENVMTKFTILIAKNNQRGGT